jgi:hypothetical protein
MAKNKLLRMDNVGIVVESLDETISFFAELGLKLEGRARVEGEWAGRVSGLGTQFVGEVVQYEDSYRLCYIRGPEGLLIGLAEQLGTK